MSVYTIDEVYAERMNCVRISDEVCSCGRIVSSFVDDLFRTICLTRSCHQQAGNYSASDHHRTTLSEHCVQTVKPSPTMYTSDPVVVVVGLS